MTLPLVAVVGPTGIGKTALGIKIAQQFSGQIISADSRQIYRYMNIGSAKPTAAELAQAPHHLIDLISPDCTVTLAEFQERAYQAIDKVHRALQLPILAGGTGQWVWAVLEGWGIPRVPPDEALRAELQAEAEAIGPQAFHAKLAEVDPDAAAKLDYRNVRRVIRAREVYLKTGIPISAHQKKTPPPYSSFILGLTMPRDELYLRIDNRIDKMIAAGLLDEVKNLLDRGYSFNLPAMSGLGYKEFKDYLNGNINLEESVALIKKNTRRFIRQQYNWFRLNDKRISWLDVSSAHYERMALEQVEAFVK